jgi:hypothetical protein
MENEMVLSEEEMFRLTSLLTGWDASGLEDTSKTLASLRCLSTVTSRLLDLLALVSDKPEQEYIVTTRARKPEQEE